jgi:hypothetical protein
MPLPQIMPHELLLLPLTESSWQMMQWMLILWKKRNAVKCVSQDKQNMTNFKCPVQYRVVWQFLLQVISTELHFWRLSNTILENQNIQTWVLRAFSLLYWYFLNESVWWNNGIIIAVYTVKKHLLTSRGMFKHLDISLLYWSSWNNTIHQIPSDVHV